MGMIDVISCCVVQTRKEDITTTSSISKLELNPWDLRLLPIPPIQRALIFHNPQIQSPHTLIHHLKFSLSRTLAFFPPLAGRLAITPHDDGTTTFFISCNNAGADFTHAAAAAVYISDLIEPKYVPEIMYSFFPLNDTTNIEGISKPLLAVQVTELADGLFIGCAANHAVVDGTSFWHFLNSWSEISRDFLTISKIPVFDRSIPSKLAGYNRIPPPLEQNPSTKLAPTTFIKRIFHFSRESLGKLKAEANFEGGVDNISSFQALSALLWRTIARCRQPERDRDDRSSGEVEFAIIVGARSRIGLPEWYFGNAIYTAGISVSECELLRKGIGYAALKMNELVSQQNSEATIKDLGNSENRTLMRNMKSFFIIGSPRHDVYGNDFGWGKPVAARNGKGRDFDGKTTVFPAAESGGIDVEVCLTSNKMVAVEDDLEFMSAFTS